MTYFLFALGLTAAVLAFKELSPYKFRYVRRKLYNACGRCEKCGSKLNYTGKGRAVCPNKTNHPQE